MTVIAVLQARMSSSRLPGKVLLPILGQPMLARQIERIRRSRLLDDLIVATSSDKSDDPIQALCASIGTACHRGSLEDVLDRLYKAALPREPDSVVRLTGDCPLADPDVIDAVIALHLDGGYDYTSNIDPPTFPDGLDVEVIRRSALVDAWNEARLPSEREHVTPFIRNNRERFRAGVLPNAMGDLSQLRWTVDEPVDFELVSAIYESLYPRGSDFTTADVLRLLAERPDLAGLNARFERNEGLLKSLARDAELLRDGS